jgi:flagellar hook-associated protein 3 FlgL
VRITLTSTYAKTAREINQKKEDLDRLTTMASSGSRILKQADDPLAWSQAMDFRQTIRQIDAFQKNIDFAVGWNQVSDNALNRVTDLVERAKQLAIQAISAPSTAKREAQTQELNQIIEEAVNLANSQYRDQYVFSGRQFSTAPFTLTKDASGEVQSISGYQGDTQDLEVRTGNGVRQAVNINGQDVFGNPDNTSGILYELLQLKNAVRDGDTTAIQQQEAAIDASYQNLQHQSAIVGTRLEAFDEKKSLLDSIKIDDQSQLSDIADADMAEVISQLQQKQTVFQAVLRVTGLLAELNLTRFL